MQLFWEDGRDRTISCARPEIFTYSTGSSARTCMRAIRFTPHRGLLRSTDPEKDDRIEGTTTSLSLLPGKHLNTRSFGSSEAAEVIWAFLFQAFVVYFLTRTNAMHFTFMVCLEPTSRN